MAHELSTNPEDLSDFSFRLAESTLRQVGWEVGLNWVDRYSVSVTQRSEPIPGDYVREVITEIHRQGWIGAERFLWWRGRSATQLAADPRVGVFLDGVRATLGRWAREIPTRGALLSWSLRVPVQEIYVHKFDFPPILRASTGFFRVYMPGEPRRLALNSIAARAAVSLLDGDLPGFLRSVVSRYAPHTTSEEYERLRRLGEHSPEALARTLISRFPLVEEHLHHNGSFDSVIHQRGPHGSIVRLIPEGPRPIPFPRSR